jgi:hypothetical protein
MRWCQRGFLRKIGLDRGLNDVWELKKQKWREGHWSTGDGEAKSQGTSVGLLDGAKGCKQMALLLRSL